MSHGAVNPEEIEKKKAAAVRPIDEDPLYIQLRERYDTLHRDKESIFASELSGVLDLDPATSWDSAIAQVSALYGADFEVTANAELIKANELLEVVMKRAESDWAYFHARIQGLKCMSNGTWREVADELSQEIYRLQERSARLASAETALDALRAQIAPLKVAAHRWFDAVTRVDVEFATAEERDLAFQLTKAGWTALPPSRTPCEEGFTKRTTTEEPKSSVSNFTCYECTPPVSGLTKDGYAFHKATDHERLLTKQRTEEPKPPVPRRGVVESEDASKNEPTKEDGPEQARRAAKGEDVSTEPFYQAVNVAVQAYPLIKQLGKILRGKRVP